MPHAALLLIDLQPDFLPGGALAVPDGNTVIPLANRLATRFETVVLTQDWHPPGHRSFASAHPGRAPFETISLPYGEQVLWPDHCIQATPGAALAPGLDVPHAGLILRKGCNPAVDSYSAFAEADGTTTGLAAWLRARGPGYEAAFGTTAPVRCAVNQDFSTLDAPVRPGDEIAFFPPVTGG